MNETLRRASSAAHDVAGWIPMIARVGYAAKGVVYLLIGYIAVRAAMAAGQAQGASGALASLRDESGGRTLLLVIAIGLLCHVAWRAVQALLDPEHAGGPGGGKRLAMRGFYALSGAVYGSLALTAWQISRGTRGAEGADESQVWIARLLDKPAGAWLVMGAGLGVVIYGVVQLMKAWKGDVNKRIEPGSARAREAMQALGRLGTAARGLVLLPIGWFVFTAGRLYRSDAAVDTGEVLKMLGSGGLLAVVGAGLAAYGAHQIGKARYRRIAPPS